MKRFNRIITFQTPLIILFSLCSALVVQAKNSSEHGQNIADQIASAVKMAIYYVDETLIKEIIVSAVDSNKQIKALILTDAHTEQPMVIFHRQGEKKIFVDLIVKKTGFKLNVVHDEWNTLLSDFRKGRIDLLPVTYYTEERATYGLYSQPYFAVREFLYVQQANNSIRSFNDLNGKKLAIVKGYLY